MPETITSITEEFTEETASTGLSDEAIRKIINALHEPDNNNYIALIKELSHADTADLLQKISDDDRKFLLDNNRTDIDPHAFSYMDPDLRKSTLSTMTSTQVAQIVAARR